MCIRDRSRIKKLNFVILAHKICGPCRCGYFKSHYSSNCSEVSFFFPSLSHRMLPSLLSDPPDRSVLTTILSNGGKRKIYRAKSTVPKNLPRAIGRVYRLPAGRNKLITQHIGNSSITLSPQNFLTTSSLAVSQTGPKLTTYTLSKAPSLLID